jgi:hypothetical protein
MRLDPHLAALIASTTGIGLLMALSGVHKRLLGWKRRICPACGREIRARVCPCAQI